MELDSNGYSNRLELAANANNRSCVTQLVEHSTFSARIMGLITAGATHTKLYAGMTESRFGLKCLIIVICCYYYYINKLEHGANANSNRLELDANANNSRL